MKKRASFFLALLVALNLCLSPAPRAAAAESEALQAAQQLYDLGLFKGVGTGPDGSPDLDLDRAPTRAEAVTMLVRLFGDEATALNGRESPASSGYVWGEYACPFTDVADWAKPYVAYAYDYGLTKGCSETAFGGERPVSATEYLTFVLRAMGYQSGEEFQWDRAWELSDRLGITDGQYDAATGFTRGDVALVSLRALQRYSPLLLVHDTGKWQNVGLTYPEGPDGEGEGFVFTPVVPLRDVEIVEYTFRFEADDTVGDPGPVVGETLRQVGDLAPGQALRVRLYLGDVVPGWAVRFTDQAGQERTFYVAESLRDGNTLFRERD